MIFISKSLEIFVPSEAEEAFPSSLPKGDHVFAFCYHLSHNWRAFSLFFLPFIIITNKDGSSVIIFFLSSFKSFWACFHLSLLVPVILYTGTHWVSSTFVLAVCFISWWRHRKGREQNSLLLTDQGWKQPTLVIFLLNGFQKLKYYLLSTGNIILPTSLSKLTAEKKKYKIKLKMFVLPSERRWKLHNFSLLPFAPPEVMLPRHLQFKLLFAEVNNSAVRLQTQFNIWQSFCLEIVPLVHIYNTFSQRVS